MTPRFREDTMKKIFLSIFLGLSGVSFVNASVDHLLPEVKSCLQKDTPGFYLKRNIALTDPTSTELLRDVLSDNGATLSETSEAKVNVQIVNQIPGAFNHKLADYPD